MLENFLKLIFFSVKTSIMLTSAEILEIKKPFSHLEIELCLYSLKSFSLKWFLVWNSKLNTSSVDQINPQRKVQKNDLWTWTKKFVRSGIRTHASKWRPEHSLTLIQCKISWVWRLRPLGHPDSDVVGKSQVKEAFLCVNSEKKKEWRIRVSIPVPLAC